MNLSGYISLLEKKIIMFHLADKILVLIHTLNKSFKFRKVIFTMGDLEV